MVGGRGLFSRCAVWTIVAFCGIAPAARAQGPAFKIVVLEGEGGVNIVQQKTAVAPVVEVRDRNDQPVAGAVLTFGIRRGSATFAKGAKTLTVTTDAAGRATASGLTPTGNGALQIQVSARIQGQVVSTTISQSNVATAAQAAQAGQGAAGGTGASGTGAGAGSGAGAGAGAAGAAGAAAAAGAGGGAAAGGFPILAVAGVAAGAGTATAVAVSVSGDDSSTPSAPTPVTYTGTFSTPYVVLTATAFATNPTSCVSTRTFSGTITFTVTTSSTGTVTGSAQVATSQTPVSDVGCSVPFTGSSGTTSGSVSGSTSSLGMTNTVPITGSAFFGPVNGQSVMAFQGAVSGNTIPGTLTFNQSATGTSDGSNGRPAGAAITLNGAFAIAVTLR